MRITEEQIQEWLKEDDRFPHTYAYDYIRTQTRCSRGHAAELVKKMANLEGLALPHLLISLAIEFIRMYPKLVIDHILPETSDRKYLRDTKWLP